ncbi:hypothetical protein IU474_15040 [Nocardia otitidiscaviarum]|uniref:DUF6542 domain-containing protein n=1 Tax=Nocardia otitidiscaviarum TaxID=1823 RepID=UPI001895D140|nr:DUF6542 domain-containing protein [Nocardia otitidiscaviarum]MBF6238373.1 hypothetical protein [Nocardia otitidiscaviarum]
MAVTPSERAEVPVSHRSILPTVPGIPAGAAVLIAVTCTFLGFFIDASGGSELTLTFSSLYVLGCVLAVLAVRYRGLFTVLVLPPLLLFFAVPLAYQQLLGNAGSLKLKDILLNLAIPLVNRFPTMALATVLVLAIGGLRIYLHRHEGMPGDDRPRARTRGGRSGGATRARRSRTGEQDPARRRSRAARAADAEFDDPAPKSGSRGRRPTGRVAERPPRVGSDRTAADRKRTPVDRKPAGERTPPADRRSGDRTPPAAAARKPRGDQPPRRRTAASGEVPPHPRPNVRYRDRDSGRIER